MTIVSQAGIPEVFAYVDARRQVFLFGDRTPRVPWRIVVILGVVAIKTPDEIFRSTGHRLVPPPGSYLGCAAANLRRATIKVRRGAIRQAA